MMSIERSGSQKEIRIETHHNSLQQDDRKDKVNNKSRKQRKMSPVQDELFYSESNQERIADELIEMDIRYQKLRDKWWIERGYSPSFYKNNCHIKGYNDIQQDMDDCTESMSYASLAYSSDTESQDSLCSLYNSEGLTNEKEETSNTNLTKRQEKKLKLQENWRRMRNEFRVHIQMYDIYYNKSKPSRERPKQLSEETLLALKKGNAPLKLFIFRKHQKRKNPEREMLVFGIVDETPDEHLDDNEIDKFEKRFLPAITPVRRNSLEIYSEQGYLRNKYGKRIPQNLATKETKEEATSENVFGINFELQSKRNQQAKKGTDRLRVILLSDWRIMEQYRRLDKKITEIDEEKKTKNETDGINRDMFLKMASKSMTGTSKGLRFVSRISVHKLKISRKNFMETTTTTKKPLASISEEKKFGYLKRRRNLKSEKKSLPHRENAVNGITKETTNQNDASENYVPQDNNKADTQKTFKRKVVQLTPAQIWQRLEEIDKITGIFVRKRQAFSDREDTFKDRLSSEAKGFESIEKNADFECVYQHLVKRYIELQRFTVRMESDIQPLSEFIQEVSDNISAAIQKKAKSSKKDFKKCRDGFQCLTKILLDTRKKKIAFRKNEERFKMRLQSDSRCLREDTIEQEKLKELKENYEFLLERYIDLQCYNGEVGCVYEDIRESVKLAMSTFIRPPMERPSPTPTVSDENDVKDDSGKTVVDENDVRDDSGKTVVDENDVKDDSGKTVVDENDVRDDSGKTVVDENDVKDDGGKNGGCKGVVQRRGPVWKPSIQQQKKWRRPPGLSHIIRPKTPTEQVLIVNEKLPQFKSIRSSGYGRQCMGKVKPVCVRTSVGGVEKPSPPSSPLQKKNQCNVRTRAWRQKADINKKSVAHPSSRIPVWHGTNMSISKSEFKSQDRIKTGSNATTKPSRIPRRRKVMSRITEKFSGELITTIIEEIGEDRNKTLKARAKLPSKLPRLVRQVKQKAACNAGHAINNSNKNTNNNHTNTNNKSNEVKYMAQQRRTMQSSSAVSQKVSSGCKNSSSPPLPSMVERQSLRYIAPQPPEGMSLPRSPSGSSPAADSTPASGSPSTVIAPRPPEGRPCNRRRRPPTSRRRILQQNGVTDSRKTTTDSSKDLKPIPSGRTMPESNEAARTCRDIPRSPHPPSIARNVDNKPSIRRDLRSGSLPQLLKTNLPDNSKPTFKVSMKCHNCDTLLTYATPTCSEPTTKMMNQPQAYYNPHANVPTGELMEPMYHQTSGMYGGNLAMQYPHLPMTSSSMNNKTTTKLPSIKDFLKIHSPPTQCNEIECNTPSLPRIHRHHRGSNILVRKNQAKSSEQMNAAVSNVPCLPSINNNKMITDKDTRCQRQKKHIADQVPVLPVIHQTSSKRRALFFNQSPEFEEVVSEDDF